MKPTPQPRQPHPDAVAVIKQPISDPVVAGVTSTPASAGAGGAVTKLTIRLGRELLGRVRAAYVMEGLPAGYTSLSSWVAAVLEERVVGAESRLNGGKQFMPLGIDVIPKGRLS